MGFVLADWATLWRAEVDDALDREVQAVWPPAFLEPVRYPVFGGGKRMRPLLTLAAAEALGRPGAEAMSAACAVELVHTYSLVHDDLPCMDDDDERRGRPTSHRVHGEAVALLVGDALLTEAFGVLARAALSASARVELVRLLASAAGAAGMVGGQVGDVTWDSATQDLEALRAVHERKTGALIAASVEMGGVAAGASSDQRERLASYGRAVGLAFQMADDVLDAEEDDGEEGPPSYVRLLGRVETERRARALVEEACASVGALPSPEALIALARYTVDRSV